MIYKKIKFDYLAYLEQPTHPRIIIAFFRISGFRTSVLYRLGNLSKAKKMKITSTIITRLIRVSAPVDIDISASIGQGISFPHPLCIVIGDSVVIGDNCKIMQGVTIGGSLGKKKKDGQSQPRLGNNVFVGAGAKIIGPVNISDNVIIGANSVITKDVPADTIALGIPAVYKLKENDS